MQFVGPVLCLIGLIGAVYSGKSWAIIPAAMIFGASLMLVAMPYLTN